MNYFALTTRGLEDWVKKEIKQKLANAIIKDVSYRKVIFSFEGHNAEVLKLRSVEDVFIFLGEIDSVGHTKDSLDELVNKISTLDFKGSLYLISKERNFPVKEFSISSSSIGKRNYSYIEVKKSLSKKLEEKLHLKYEDERHETFDIRVFIEHDKAIVGARLNNRPLHRRAYKVQTTKATLQADIAYVMSMLAELKKDDIVLDPMCGSGTILIESSTFNPKSILGGDINSEAVNIALKNIEAFNFNLKISIKNWDANKLPLENCSVDKVICNLPFGKQIDINNVGEFYLESIREFSRVLKFEGQMVLLTSAFEELVTAVNDSNLSFKSKLEITINGEKAYICVLQK